MNFEQFNTYCSRLPATEKVIQWGGAHVWKVGGKVFAIASHWGEGNGHYKIGFKASDMGFMMLTQEAGIQPSPDLGRYKWVQLQHPDALPQEDIKAYINLSHEMVTSKLTKASRRALNLP